jgi:tripartite-type tricarboxylate transporter receptor subunit TctC
MTWMSQVCTGPARRLAATAWFLLAPAFVPSPLLAQDYPNRPIKLVVGFPPGGGTDAAARVISAEMAKGLGQPIVIENKPGAAGTLGAAEVARSAPDGYTILVTPGGHSIYGAIFKALPFDTVASFEWVSGIITIPFLVIVPPNSEFRTLSDLIARAKAAPGTVSFGSAGPGSTHHLGLELLASRTGTKFLHVPYRGDAPVITALLGGEVQFGLATPTLALENVRAGKLRALAVTTGARSASLPEAPTVAEALGIGFDVRSWFAMAAPAGTPKPIITRLNAELRKAAAMPEVHARLSRLGEVATNSPEEMRERVTSELQVWIKTVDDARIEKQ